MQKSIDKIYYAAIYLRLSKEDGDLSSGEKKESNSIANQRKLIEDYLSRNPEITLVQEFCDDGYTGANFDRPDFQRMMEQVKTGFCGRIPRHSESARCRDRVLPNRLRNFRKQAQDHSRADAAASVQRAPGTWNRQILPLSGSAA